VPVDKALGREGNFPAFHVRFQKVADLHMDLLADVLRYHDLKLVLYGHDFHAAISSSTVEQYNFGGLLSIALFKPADDGPQPPVPLPDRKRPGRLARTVHGVNASPARIFTGHHVHSFALL
jgi:hypothetical protein